MNFTPRKMFVIVGDPHSGKTRTIQQLFQRKKFYAFKQPIKLDSLWKEKFIVANIQPHHYRPDDYLHYIKSVIQHHTTSDTSFLFNTSLVLDDSIHDTKKILTYFNESAFAIHYLVLCASWHEKKVIPEDALLQLDRLVGNGVVHRFERLVKGSELRFGERVAEVREVIRKVVDCK